MPELVTLGEPMVEFAALEKGPLEEVSTFRRGWGGDTNNVAVAAARLGMSAGCITRVGGDEFGRSLLTLWDREGVDRSRVAVDPEGYTGIYFISFDVAGRHAFAYYRKGSAASRLCPEDVDPEYVRNARMLHTSGITQAISPTARAAVEAAVAMARAGGVTVSYDLNLRPRLLPLPELRAAAHAILPQTDIVFLSLEDAAYLDDTCSPEVLVERLLEQGPRLVVLKMGERGCLVADASGGRAHVPAYPVQPVDTTGAGDAFDAAFLVRWTRGASPKDAARFANAVGALAVCGLGAVAALPSLARVEAFLQEGHHATGRRGSG
ncbi:MAG: sugar kinase [Armatimonadota bacterium]|nr:sugar kinase [Armatimonadota bacterium]MDR7438301.1 sugar kinase [Armatimonadota bacterium]MDR7443377.1 sugar kinase [Armatimonadota bacterium]MDR7563899.1 sugar kinase [Armatimonadota bacterium]MDR7567262.1 sugar kinase [Armatimonadota bacterium]